MDFLIEIEYNIYDAFIDKWFLYIKYIVENKKYIHKKYIHNKINKKKSKHLLLIEISIFLNIYSNSIHQLIKKLDDGL